MKSVSIAFALGLTGGLIAAAAVQPVRYDLIIRNGRVVDGTGNPWFIADVAVAGDTIAAIGRSLPGESKNVVDATGLTVSPGFIDVHTHARRGLFEVPTADNYVRQGVTTVIEGNDGSSPVPLAPFLAKVEAARPAVNFGTFIGQGSVRREVMGNADRAVTATELDQMRTLVRTGMRDGAFGLSSGLLYVPGAFTPAEEVTRLAREAGALGGIYISHMRDEAARVLDSVRETIAVGELGGLPTQVTHHKLVGVPNWKKSTETLQLVTEARARGVDVTIDQYPYTASSTNISVLLPRWALEGTDEAVRKRLDDPPTLNRIRGAIVDNLANDRGGGDAEKVTIAACSWDSRLTGRSLAQITRMRGYEPSLDAVVDTVIFIVRNGDAQGVFHALLEEDVERILAFPWTMVASDGEIPVFGKGAPHPRSYGTFVRVLGHYVRERRVLPLEEAVRKMTSFPAQRIGLSDRGLLRAGGKADIAVWDPARIRDVATFTKPHRYAEGVTVVLVNGRLVFDGQKMTGERPGRVLRHPDHGRPEILRHR